MAWSAIVTNPLASVEERMKTPSPCSGRLLTECIGTIARAAELGFDVAVELAWLREQGPVGIAAADLIEEESRRG